MSRCFYPISLVLTLVLALLGTAARADEVDEVNRLHRAGQTAEALQRAQRFIASRPDAAPMRFLMGVMLADSQRHAEAIEVFQRLTLDHPQLAESHNNLAALHAAAGDYERARQALEQALRANPDYATAHENMGDVLAMLASRGLCPCCKARPWQCRPRPQDGAGPRVVHPEERYGRCPDTNPALTAIDPTAKEFNGAMQ